MRKSSSSEQRVKVTDEQRARVWELHLRGVPKLRIAAAVGLHRETVARVLSALYRELGSDRRAETKHKLEAAIARMRRIGEQAWDDHDADDERERSALHLLLAGGEDVSESGESGADSDKGRRLVDKNDRASGKFGVRYQSQRSQYLRIALDAEKEIARLEGLYDGVFDEGSAVVVVRIERLNPAAPLGIPGTAVVAGAVEGGEGDDVEGGEADDAVYSRA